MTGARFITPAELEGLMPMIEKEECTLLDMRSPAEFRSGQIKHAKLLPVEQLEKGADEIAKGKPLVIYCRTGKRCLRVLPVLATVGQGDVLVLAGGLHRWQGRLVFD